MTVGVGLCHPREAGSKGRDAGMQQERYAVYIMASQRNGTLYVGSLS